MKIVRNQGYAIDEEENELGIRCLGAPILDGRGRPVAAISVSGPVFQMTKKFVQEVVKKGSYCGGLRNFPTVGLSWGSDVRQSDEIIGVITARGAEPNLRSGHRARLR